MTFLNQKNIFSVQTSVSPRLRESQLNFFSQSHGEIEKSLDN